VVTFEAEAAAKTAVLLNNALINERAISVTLAPPDFEVPKATVDKEDLPAPHTIPADQRSQTSVIASLLQSGYQLGEDTLAKANEFDAEHGISQTLSDTWTSVTSKVNEFDETHGISTKAKELSDGIQTRVSEIDQSLGISERTREVSEATGNVVTGITTSIKTSVQDAQEYVNQNESFQQAAGKMAEIQRAASESISSLIWGPDENQGGDAAK
jgi:uncharacterized protein YoxC